MEGYKENAKLYAGHYMEARTAITTSDRLIFVLSGTELVNVNSDGTINFRDTKYVEVEPLLFKEVGGQGTLVFHKDEKYNIMVFLDRLIY